MQLFRKRRGPSAILCFFIGGLSGYPVGARFSALLGRESLAPYTNLCSPMFLLGVVSIGLCGNKAMFWPLAVAHYGTALLGLVFQLIFRNNPEVPIQASGKESGLTIGGMFNEIGEGMFSMLRIGGCILFFYVFSQLLSSVLLGERSQLLSAILTSLFEITAGCGAVSALGLSSQLTAGMLAFFLSLGGACVFVQAMLAAQLDHPGAYLFQKLVLALFSGLTAFYFAPLFLSDTVTVLSNTAQVYRDNALAGFAFVASACVGLSGCYLFGQIFYQKNAREHVPSIQSHRSI